MPTLEERRILFQGGSYLITLPAGWIKYNGLVAGQKLLVKTNTRLIIEKIKPKEANA